MNITMTDIGVPYYDGLQKAMYCPVVLSSYLFELTTVVEQLSPIASSYGLVLSEYRNLGDIFPVSSEHILLRNNSVITLSDKMMIHNFEASENQCKTFAGIARSGDEFVSMWLPHTEPHQLTHLVKKDISLLHGIRLLK